MAMTVEKFRKLVALDPKDPLSRFALGKKLLETNQSLNEAAEHLRFSNRADPSHLATYFNLGKVLLILGETEEARGVLAEGVRRVGAVGEGMGRDLGPLMEDMLASIGTPRREREAVIRLAGPGEVVELRHKVLRQDMPREAAMFSNDDAPLTRHGVAVVDGKIACCATFIYEPHEGTEGWRLRGMATDPEFRSMSLGRRVLALLEEDSQRLKPTPILWCNARIGAVKFYESLGWRVVTAETYDIPSAGLHHTMVKTLNG